MELENLPPRIVAMLLLVLQGTLLDCYLVKYNNLKWLGWIVTDVFVIIIWTLVMFGSAAPMCNLLRGWLIKIPKGDDLTAAYFAWLAYLVHLVPRVVAIFKTFSDKLDKDSFFSPNSLKLTLSITPKIFICLVYSHRSTEDPFARKTYIQTLISSITFDLFDAMEMLKYLFDKEFISTSTENAIITLTCVNLILPVLALYELKNNKFHENGQVPAVSFKLLYAVSFLFLVNIPYLVIRAYLWHTYKLDVSILFAKNILGIYFGVTEIVEYLREGRPTQCSECKKTFAKSHLKNHVKTCRQPDETEEMDPFIQPKLNASFKKSTYL